MLPYVRPPGGCKLDAFNNFLLFRLFCPSFLFGCCIFSRISAGFCQGEFSRTSARSLPGVSSVCLARGLCGRRGRECLPWLMSQGPVMLLGPIGFEGALVFRKICSAAMIRLAKTRIPTSVQLFCDCGLLSVVCEAEMGRCASNSPLFSGFIRVLASRGNPQSQKSCKRRPIFVFGLLDWPHASVMGGVPRAQRLCGRLWTALWAWADLAARCGGCAWRATRAAGCSGQHDAVNGVDLGQLYGWLWIDPARSAWNDPARRHKKYCHCLCARPMRQVHLLGGILAFCPPSLGFFRLPYLRALLPSFHRRTSCTAVS